MVHNMPIFVRSSFDKPEDIDPHGTPPGTLICSEEEIMESHVVTGIAFSKDEAQISVRQIQDKPGVAAAIFGPLAEANINVDMIVQNVSEDGATTDLTFTVPAQIMSAPAIRLPVPRPRSVMRGSTAPPTWRKSRSSAAACAAMPASLRKRLARLLPAISTSAPSPPPKSSFRC